jgi:hypothetical protein
MRAEDMKAGDQLHKGGRTLYQVVQVHVYANTVVAKVQYADGGFGNREWDIGDDVPLTRPNPRKGR